MPKTFRFQFDKGVNVVADKATLEPGYVTVADNVDLRAGLPRPFKAPVKYSNAPGGTTRIFEYRGKFYTSSTMRDYAAEYVDGRDRVYYCEYGAPANAEGRVHKEGATRKIIDGLDVPLGTRAPNLAPLVSETDALTPVLTAVASSGGSFKKDTTRSYRVSAVTANGVQVPCAPSQITFTADNQKVDLEWTTVPNAVSYWVFAGEPGKEAKIGEVSAIDPEFEDTGAAPGTGDRAVNYDVNAIYTYVYTFERTVSGMTNESGPSPISAEFQANISRKISFDVLNDGFFNQDDAQSVPQSQVTIVKSVDYNPALSVSTLDLDDKTKRALIKTTTRHGLKSGDYVYVGGAVDGAWNGKLFEVFVDTANIDQTVFSIKDVPQPVDTSFTSWQIIPAKTKVTLSPAPAQPVQTDDVVYVNIGGSSQQLAGQTFKATALSSTEFVINAFTDGNPTASDAVRWVPKNGYIKYRNLYRTGDSGGFFLVEQVPIWKSSYLDDKTFSKLGDAISSVYTENGIQVVYEHPPIGMQQITSHYEMLFAIDQNKVRWTPAGAPDAWPTDFTYDFPSKPVALVSFAGSLIVLCLDAIYRIDGNEPTQLSRRKTLAEKGCIAPYSVQRTPKGLLYMSDEGIELFDGNTSVCITAQKVPSNFLLGPSGLAAPVYHWWHPTLMGYNYTNLSAQDGILYKVTNAFVLNNTNAPGGVIKQARSFYYKGKYFLFWAAQESNDYYRAHTTFCIDLQAPGFPVTTLGMKPIDAHVSDTEQAYVLVGSPEITADAALAAFRMNFVYAGFGSHFIAEWVSSKFTGGSTTPQTGSFTIAVSPATTIGYPSTAKTFTVTITRSSFTGLVNLSLSGLPSGVTGAFNPSVTSGNSATLTLQIASNATPGRYLITVVGASGTVSQVATLQLEVAAGTDFGLTINPTNTTVAQGGAATSTLAITRSAGFVSTVTFSAEGLPTGATATFTPSSTEGNGGNVSVAIPTTLGEGTYPVTLKATGGSVTKSAVFTINVTKATSGGGPTYKGKFNLTGAILAWDCQITSGTMASMPNQVVGSTLYDGTRLASYAFDPSTFTESTVYKTSPSGTSNVLGVDYFGGTLQDFYRYSVDRRGTTYVNIASNQRYMIQVPSAQGLDSLTKDLAYNTLPVKSVCGIFWQDAYAAADILGLFTYCFNKSGETYQNNLFLRRNGTTIQLDWGELPTVAEIDISTTWGFAKGIVFVGMTVDLNAAGVGTVTLYVNKATASASIDLGTAGVAASYLYDRQFSVGPTWNTEDMGLVPTNPNNKFACLEFVAYSDVKDVSFMANNATAWGL